MSTEQTKENLSKDQSLQQETKIPAVNTPPQLHDLLKDFTQKVQQKNLQIREAADKPVTAKENFNDLKEANLGGNLVSDKNDK